MNNSSDGILESMDMMLAHLKEIIIDEGKKQASQIHEEAYFRLEELKSKNLYQRKKESALIEVRKKVRQRTNQWTTSFNSTRERLIKNSLEEVFKTLKGIKGTKIYPELIKALYYELESELEDHPIIIHVTRDSGKFLPSIPPNCQVKEDLTEIGVLLEFIEHSIVIENTLESRLRLIQPEIELLINNELFSGMEEPPWKESQILDILMRESTD